MGRSSEDGQVKGATDRWPSEEGKACDVLGACVCAAGLNMDKEKLRRKLDRLCGREEGRGIIDVVVSGPATLTTGKRDEADVSR